YAEPREFPVHMGTVPPRAPQAFLETVREALLVPNIVDRLRKFPVGDTRGPEAQDPLLFFRQVVPLASCQHLQDLYIVRAAPRYGVPALGSGDFGRNVDP